MVSQLLAEMDGVHTSKGIFILGATNRKDLLDPAILRPGRFDESFEVKLYDKTTQPSVFRATIKKFQLDEDVNVETVEVLIQEKFPPEMSGADIYSVCSGAWKNALRRIVKCPDVDEDKAQVVVNLQDFEQSCEKYATLKSS